MAKKMDSKLVNKQSENQFQWNEAESLLVLPSLLTIDVVADLLKKHKCLELPVKEVDFSQVNKADSAILAVLLVWAQNAQTTIRVKQLPEELLTLVNLYDLDTSVSLV